MKRTRIALLTTVACLFITGSVAAQLGSMNPFSKPNITDIFKPVVGGGAVYETEFTDKSEQPRQMEMFIVGKESVDGQEGWWMEMGHQEHKTGEMQYMKMLVTSDFTPRKMVMQQPGKGAMEIAIPADAKDRNHMKEELEKWHKVGMEPITVPAGTFLCQHWKKDSGVGDVWASDKITPMGMVKSVQEHETMVLVKVISGATDHITGPVTKFDPQMMRQQMMEKMQQQKRTPDQ
jgi:hypothetical protein